MSGIALKLYEPSMQADIERFYADCFTALGWGYEPTGRHGDTVNIPAAYMTGGRFWCLYDKDELIGTVAIRVRENAVAEMKRLYVLPARQGEGFGGMLFKTAADYAKESGFAKLCADTRRDRSASRHLMEKYGFTETPRYNDNPYAEMFFELNLF